MRVIISRKTGRILSLILSLSMVISMCTAAYGATGSVSDEKVPATATVSAASTINPLDQAGDAGPIPDVIPEASIMNRPQGDGQDTVPAEWSTKSSPAGWSTSRYMIVRRGPNGFDTIWAPNPGYDAKRTNYVDINALNTYYLSPFSYYFSPYSDEDVEDIIDGKVVPRNPVYRVKEALEYFYRAVPLSDNYFVLVRYNVVDGSFISSRPYDEILENPYRRNASPGYFDFVYRQTERDDDPDKQDIEWDKVILEGQRCSNYYLGKDGDLQPVVQFSSRKKVWVDMANGKFAKPNEDQAIFANAVLVQFDGTNTNFVCDLPIKSVKAKDNIYATLPFDNVVELNKDSSDKTFESNYGWTWDTDRNDTDDRYTGFTSKPMLTNADNRFLKPNAQPSFTIQVAAEKDIDKAVKKYVGEANKALKNEKFNFQIARISLGTTDNDRVPGTIYYQGEQSLTQQQWDDRFDKGEWSNAYDAALENLISILDNKERAFESVYSSVYTKYLNAQNEDTKIDDIVGKSIPNEAKAENIRGQAWERYRIGDEYFYRPYGAIFINNGAFVRNLPMYMDTQLDYDIVHSNHIDIITTGGNRITQNCDLQNWYLGNYFDLSNEKGRTQLTEKNGTLKLKLCYRKPMVRISAKGLTKLIVALLKLAVGFINNGVQFMSTDDGGEVYNESVVLTTGSQPSAQHYPTTSDVQRLQQQLRFVLYYGLGGAHSGDLNNIIIGISKQPTGNTLAAILQALTGAGSIGSASHAIEDVISYLESEEGVSLTVTTAQEIISVMVANGVPVSLISAVIKTSVSYSKAKLSTKPGKSDIVMTSMDVKYTPATNLSEADDDAEAEVNAKKADNTGTGERSVPVLILKGENNAEGAATMRLGSDKKTILIGNYEDDSHWWVDEAE